MKKRHLTRTQKKLSRAIELYTQAMKPPDQKKLSAFIESHAAAQAIINRQHRDQAEKMRRCYALLDAGGTLGTPEEAMAALAAEQMRKDGILTNG